MFHSSISAASHPFPSTIVKLPAKRIPLHSNRPLSPHLALKSRTTPSPGPAGTIDAGHICRDRVRSLRIAGVMAA
jgi:hypothetical protein